MPYKPQLSELLVNVGQNVKRLRVMQYISQQGLSEDCGIDRATISRIENLDYSNITICSLVRLSMALGCKVEELMKKG